MLRLDRNLSHLLFILTQRPISTAPCVSCSLTRQKVQQLFHLHTYLRLSLLSPGRLPLFSLSRAIHGLPNTPAFVLKAEIDISSRMSSKGRSCGCKGSGSRKSRERFYNSQDFMVNCFKVCTKYGGSRAGTALSRDACTVDSVSREFTVGLLGHTALGSACVRASVKIIGRLVLVSVFLGWRKKDGQRSGRYLCGPVGSSEKVSCAVQVPGRDACGFVGRFFFCRTCQDVFFCLVEHAGE